MLAGICSSDLVTCGRRERTEELIGAGHRGCAFGVADVPSHPACRSNREDMGSVECPVKPNSCDPFLTFERKMSKKPKSQSPSVAFAIFLVLAICYRQGVLVTINNLSDPTLSSGMLGRHLL